MQIRIVDAGGPHELANIELMHRQGFLEAQGLHVRRTYVTNGAEAVELLLAGEADAAIQVGFGPALAAIVQGAPLKVIGASNLLTVHAIYTTRPDIRRLADLTGRTVGVGRLGALTHQLIYAALLKHGVDPAGVTFVPIGNSFTIFQRLRAGGVDAGFGETEVFENQGHYGVHALDDGVLWEELPQFPNQASFATVAAICDKRQALTAALAGHAAFYRYLHGAGSWEAYAEARAAALPGAHLDESRAQWLFYHRHRPYAEDLALPPAGLAYLQDLNVRMGLQSEIAPFDAVADMSLARDAVRLVERQTNMETRR